MKVTGSATVQVPRDELWKALNDPAVLVRTIPGCSRLEEISPDAYRMTIYAGVASIKGTYQGEVRLADQHQPDSFVLHASGAGAPGTVNADVSVHLSDQGSTTLIDYDADAVVGGMIGGVGQRVLGGVAKKTAGEFFSAVEGVVAGAAADQVAIGQTAPDGLAVGGPSADQSTVGRPPPTRSRPADPKPPPVPGCSRRRWFPVGRRHRCSAPMCAECSWVPRSPCWVRSWAAGSPAGGEPDACVHRRCSPGPTPRSTAEPGDHPDQRGLCVVVGAALRCVVVPS